MVFKEIWIMLYLQTDNVNKFSNFKPTMKQLNF